MSNQFRESIREVSLVELTQDIDVSDQLLADLQDRDVITDAQCHELRVRCHTAFTVYYIAYAADFIGAMGAITSTTKKLWGDAPSRSHRNFVMSIFGNIKISRSASKRNCV